MQPREFNKRWVNSRERLFNPETPPDFQWPELPVDGPDRGANWDFLIFVMVGAIGAAALFFVIAMLFILGLV